MRRRHGRSIRDATERRELERWYRRTGYDDGYAGTPARSRNAHYQTGWRAGRAAKKGDEQQ